MMSGDEFYPDDCTSGPDPREMGDFRLAELEATFACQGCGSREPARLNADCTRCSDCGLDR